MGVRKTIDHNDTELALRPNRRIVLEYQKEWRVEVDADALAF